jgi:hypothetical protein
MTCKKPICSDCAVMDSQHRDHKIERLKDVYDRHVELIRIEASELRRRIKDLNSSFQEA